MPVVCSRLGAGGLGAYSSKGTGENCPGSSPDLDPTSSWFLLLLLRRGTTAFTQHFVVCMPMSKKSHIGLGVHPAPV